MSTCFKAIYRQLQSITAVFLRDVFCQLGQVQLGIDQAIPKGDYNEQTDNDRR